MNQWSSTDLFWMTSSVEDLVFLNYILSLNLSYFALSIWQLLLYFYVENVGYISAVFYLCVAMKKDRCVCVYIYTHTDKHSCLYTVTHTQNCAGKPPPSFSYHHYWTIHPWFWVTWNLTKDLGHNQPKLRQASIANLEMLKNNAAPSRNNLDLPHGKTSWVLGLSTHFTT